MLNCTLLGVGDFGSNVMEDPQVLAALEHTRQAVTSLPQNAEKIKSQFMRFSHLWTRPMAETLQVWHYTALHLQTSNDIP